MKMMMNNNHSDIAGILAYSLSVVLYPLFTPTYLMIAFLLLFSRLVLPLTTTYVLYAIGGTLFFTCLVPLIVLIVMKRQGRITDLDISDHRQRMIPLTYAVLSFGFWCAYLDSVLKVPPFMFWTAVCSVLAMIACAIISNWWKISAHLASMGGVVGMSIGYLLYFGVNSPLAVSLLLIVSLLLMYARIYLQAHTPVQAVVGFLLGLVFTLTPNIILLYV